MRLICFVTTAIHVYLVSILPSTVFPALAGRTSGRQSPLIALTHIPRAKGKIQNTVYACENQLRRRNTSQVFVLFYFVGFVLSSWVQTQMLSPTRLLGQGMNVLIHRQVHLGIQNMQLEMSVIECLPDIHKALFSPHYHQKINKQKSK